MRKTDPKAINYGPEWTPDGTRDRYRWIENASRGLRIVGAVHDICRREHWRTVKHMGWFLDPFGDGETVHGAVLQIPARNGVVQYVPAIADPYDQDCYCCDFRSVTDDLRDAVRWADDMAESYAEREREYQLNESAKLRAEELREEATTLRAKHRAIVADMRALRELAPDAPNACSALRATLRKMRADIRDALKEAARLDAEPWTLLED
jgi:hypothetical protein